MTFPGRLKSSFSAFLKTHRQRISRAIDEFEERDDSQWGNIKALQGPEWKGRLRKGVGSYRIIFRKFPDRGVVEISAILLKSKHTYK